MVKSKVISLLKTLSKEEIREFALFVVSPFFNKEKVHAKLLEILKKNHPGFPPEKIEKQHIYSLLYPGRNYNDGAMRNIISDFQKLVMDFLRIKGLYRSDYYKEHFLLAELMERNERTLFDKQKLKINSVLDSGYKDDDYFLKKYFTDEHDENMNVKTSDKYLLSFESKLLDSLLPYIILKILYLNSKILNTNVNISYSIEPVMDTEFIQFLESKGSRYLEYTYINSFYLMYKLLSSGKKEFFFELKVLLEDRFSEIDRSTLRNLYTCLENYAASMLNRGEPDFYKELFYIFRKELELKIYHGGFGHMRHVFYLNVVSTGLEAGEMKWVEKFIDEYIDEVYPGYRQSCYNMAQAIIFYWKKDYDNALTFLSKVTLDDLPFKLNTRSLYMKLYYDLNETETFYSYIDSLRHFLTNNKKELGSIVDSFASYINYTKKLFDLKNSGKNTDFDAKKFLDEISQNNLIINKPWLIQKAKEII